MADTLGKSKRRSRAELRELMLDAGKEVLLDLPALVGSEQLTYSLVFQYLQREKNIKVTTGSVHERIWQSQSDYQLAVLTDVLRDAPNLPFDVAASGAIEALADVDLSSLEGRRYATRNTTRLIQNRAFNVDGFRTREEALAYAVRFHLWGRGEIGDEHNELAELARENRRASIQLYSEMVETLMQQFGLRPRPVYGGDTVAMLAILGNALFLGPLLDPAPLAREIHHMPTGPTGELQPWHTGTIGLWALVQGLLELDGDSLSDAERRL